MITLMDKKNRAGLRTWIEIDKKAIAHNYKTFRSLIPKATKYMGVLKSNAYGHNLMDFAKELEKLGADYLVVDSVVEGLALRREGIKLPIFVLGYTLPEVIPSAVEAGMEISVSNFDYLKEIEKVKTKKLIRVHVKVDTGMHRHGFQEHEMDEAIKKLKAVKNIEIVGLYTHFAAAKNPAFPKETRDQISSFNKWREAFSKAGLKVMSHACATSGTILFPEAHFDAVRIGIGQYGIWPSREVEAYAKGKITLKPVLSWKTIVVEVKKIKKGEKLGYDFTEKVERNSIVAILPIGYWYGYPRALSSIGHVLVNGKVAKIIGRVCMNIVTVDITDIPGVKVGDEVTILSSNKGSVNSVDGTSILLDCSSYELVTRLNPLMRRIFI
jgi:alanine racemase